MIRSFGTLFREDISIYQNVNITYLQVGMQLDFWRSKN